MEFEETEDDGNSIKRGLLVKIDRASRLFFQRRTAYGIVQRTISDTRRWIVLTTRFYDFEQPMGAEIIAAENVSHVQVSCSPKTVMKAK